MRSIREDLQKASTTEQTNLSYFGARYYEASLSLSLSVDPMSDKYPSLSAYNYCGWNPVMLVDPDGRDWILDESTNKFTWNKNVTNIDNTPKEFKFIGKSDNDIVKHVFGQNTFSTRDIDIGTFGLNDFDNGNVKGFGADNASATTNMDVTLTANVSSTFNSDGSLKDKKFNGINVFANVTGTIVPGQVGASYELKPLGMSLNGKGMERKTGESSFLSANKGNVPRLTFGGFVSSRELSSRSSINVSFTGGYEKNGARLALWGVTSVLGQSNNTRLRLNIPKK